ncbi:MAG TPA: hypothetical protein VGA56_14190 [Opitutaceae bacterium]
MNSLERALIAKAGYDNGWEVTVEDSVDRFILASALHRAKAEIVPDASLAAKWRVRFDHGTLAREVGRNASHAALSDHAFAVSIERDLGQLLQEAARLAQLYADANDLDAAERALRDASERMLAAVGVRFGKDSNEYEMAGGVRKSERRRSRRANGNACVNGNVAGQAGNPSAPVPQAA